MKNFLTGPTMVSEDVLSKLSIPVFGHHTREFKSLAEFLKRSLASIFDTDDPVFPFTCTVSAALEAALNNIVSDGVLVLSNGAFGERWAFAASQSDLKVYHLNFNWGMPFDPQSISQMIETNRPDTLVMVHGETSTGMLNPIAPIANILKDFPDILLVVDAVGTLGGVPLSMRDDRVDVLVGASQKCLALPPGIVPVGVSRRTFERCVKSRRQGYAFNFTLWHERWQNDETIATPAIPQMNAMAFQLQRILDDGLEKRWKRHSAMLELMKEWIGKNGFAWFAPQDLLLPTVSCIIPDGRRETIPIADRMRERGYLIDAGYGKLKNASLRIGHLGDWDVQDLEECLKTLSDVL